MRGRTLVAGLPAGALLALLLLPAGAGPAEAHAFAQRYDLPLPLGHYLAGAGAAVLLSFLAVAGLVRRPSGRAREAVFPLPRRPTEALLAVLRIVAVSLFVLLLAAGLFGNQHDWDRNILPVAVWVLWWVGLAFVCALAGDLWALVNPWAILGRWAGEALRWGGLERRPLLLPGWVGVWPAVLLFLLFAWVELVWQSNAMPRRLACAVLIYSAFTWTAMALFGVETWLRRGEVFSLLFGLFGRFAPLSGRRDEQGRPLLLLRPYGAGLAQGPLPSASLTALILTVLATVSFDGFSETPYWNALSGLLLQPLYALGLVQALGYVATGSLIKTGGLLAAPVTVAGLYLATAAVVARIEGAGWGATARRFAPSLVPIAIGYHLAHYFSYLIIQGQMAVPLASDPLGYGWDLLGTRGYRLDIGAVDMRLIWLAAVGGIVAGHVAAVLLAHGAALKGAAERRAPSRRALRGQVPLVVLMTGYTVFSLWILSQPIVTH